MVYCSLGFAYTWQSPNSPMANVFSHNIKNIFYSLFIKKKNEEAHGRKISEKCQLLMLSKKSLTVKKRSQEYSVSVGDVLTLPFWKWSHSTEEEIQRKAVPELTSESKERLEIQLNSCMKGLDSVGMGLSFCSKAAGRIEACINEVRRALIMKKR